MMWVGIIFPISQMQKLRLRKVQGLVLNVPHQGNGRASGHTVSGSLSPLATPLSASASKPAGTLQGHRSRAAGQVCKLLG